LAASSDGRLKSSATRVGHGTAVRSFAPQGRERRRAPDRVGTRSAQARVPFDSTQGKPMLPDGQPARVGTRSAQARVPFDSAQGKPVLPDGQPAQAECLFYPIPLRASSSQTAE